MFYVNVSVPLGRTGVCSPTAGTVKTQSLLRTRAMGSFNDETPSTVALSDHDDSVTNWDGSLNSNLHYTTLALGIGGDNESNRNSSIALSGGIVAHGDGVTFSPYPVTDTYAVVALDKPVAGVAIGTPRGNV